MGEPISKQIEHLTDQVKYWAELLVTLAALGGLAVAAYASWATKPVAPQLLLITNVATAVALLVLAVVMGLYRRSKQELARDNRAKRERIAYLEEQRHKVLLALNGRLAAIREVQDLLDTKQLRKPQLRLHVEGILQVACRLVGPDMLNDRACIYRVTTGLKLAIWASVGMQPDSYTRNVYDLKVKAAEERPGAVAHVFRTGMAKRMDDWGEDPHYVLKRKAPPPYEGSIMVPVMGSNDKPVGVLCVDKQSSARFTDVDEAAAGLFAYLAGQAIQIEGMLTSNKDWDGEPL